MNKEIEESSESYLKARVTALEEAKTVLDWTLAVSRAKWGQLHPSPVAKERTIGVV